MIKAIKNFFGSTTPPKPNGPSGPVMPAQSGGLGTFGGVFTPSILTILGVIMYLRFGWVVGNMGLFKTLLIVTLANSITFITALSISSISTDQKVRGGGAYYMISRSLGIETGGAIGLPLFIALALSVALYTIGFAESVVGVFPMLNQKIVGLVCVVLVAVVALASAKTAIKMQYFIMAAIIASLVSLVWGAFAGGFSSAMLASKPVVAVEPEVATAVSTESFWVVFAVFFPAVTGIMAGVNMSGDLRDPNKSIPIGTLAAVIVGYVVYMTLPILLAFSTSKVDLLENQFIMKDIAHWGNLIVMGVWGATLSSAIGSILGAPRVLQALARDNVLPKALNWLARGNGPDDEPRLGTLLTFGIAFIAVLFGNLNLIAPILTMFFLTTYAVLNMVSGIETLLRSPSFRPSFKVHWAISFLGAVGCIAVMFLINAMATISAFIFIISISIWLHQRSFSTHWGDVRQGMWMAVTQTAMRNLKSSTDPKNWRPHILVLSGAPTQRWHLIDVAHALGNEHAIMSLVTILTDPSIEPERIQSLQQANRDYLAKRSIEAYVRVFKAETPFIGTERFIQAYGFGPLVPNTILLGTTKQEKLVKEYVTMLTNLHAINRNLLVVHENETRGFGNGKRIDVWWGGLKGNGGLMMTLAYLLTTSSSWSGADIHIFMVIPNEDGAEMAEKNLERLVVGSRTGAITKVIVDHGRSFISILREHSQHADLIFLGMRKPEKFLGKDNTLKKNSIRQNKEESINEYMGYYQNLITYAKGLPTTVYTLAAQDIEFSDILA